MAEGTETNSGNAAAMTQTPSTSGENASNNSNNGSNNRYSNTSGNRPASKLTDNETKFFEGKNKHLGVLAMKNEVCVNKVTFDVFKENLLEAIPDLISTDGLLITESIVNRTDPITDLEDLEPTYDVTDTDPGYPKKFEVKYKKYEDRMSKLEDNVAKVFSLILAQCTKMVKGKFKGMTEYRSKVGNSDILWLLDELQKIVAGMNNQIYVQANLHRALLEFLLLRQQPGESIDSFTNKCATAQENLELAGGKHIFGSPQIAGSTDPDDLEKDGKAFAAYCMIHGVDRSRSGRYIKNLEESSQMGQDHYPKSRTELYDVLHDDQSKVSSNERPNQGRGRGGRSDRGGRGHHNVSFLQTNANSTNDRSCWTCGAEDHMSYDCPNRDSSNSGRGGRGPRRGINCFQFGVAFAMKDLEEILNDNWILLDTASTGNIFCNEDMLENIKDCDENNKLVLASNGDGYMEATKIGRCKYLPIDVHFNAKSLANIVSMADLAATPGVHISFDSTLDTGIVVHMAGGAGLKFLRSKHGLFYFDYKNPQNHLLNVNAVNHYSFLLQTVAHNQSHFTKKEIEGARNALQLQERLIWPTTETYKGYIRDNELLNCETTIDDIDRATLIFGTPVPLIQGTMTRRKPAPILTHQLNTTRLPQEIMEMHKNITLHMDFCFINGIPFLITKSGKVNLLSTHDVTSRSKSEMIRGLEIVLNTYNKAGFKVTTCHADSEFETLRNEIEPNLIIHAKDEHVPIIERAIRHLKEKCRAMIHGMPYTRIPKILTRAVVSRCTQGINSFVSKDGISNTMSPSAIVLGRPKINCKDKYIACGAYAQVYDKTKNNMNSRAVPGIALEAANDRGGYYFMNVYTGQKLISYIWNELPIPDEVIEAVNNRGKKEGAPIMRKGPLFEWAPGETIEDEEVEADDSSMISETNSEIDTNEVQEEYDMDQEEHDETNEEYELERYENEHMENRGIVVPISTDTSNENTNYVSDDEVEIDNNEEVEIEQAEGETSAIHVSDEEDYEPVESEQSEDSNHLENEVNEEETTEQSRPKRSNAGTGVERIQMDFKGKRYHTAVQLLTIKENVRSIINESKKVYGPGNKYENVDFYRKAVDVIFNLVNINKHPQMSAKKGMKLFGERAVAAIFKEFKQLNDGPKPGNPVLGPVNPDEMTQEEKATALETVNLIKEKRNGDIKGRSCANGSKQKFYVSDEDNISSPTPTLESLITTLVIDAHEGRDIAIFDVPGAYLHADMPPEKKLFLKMRDEFVDIMCEVNPEYTQYVRYENGKRVLYCKILKAIYGCIESALTIYILKLW